MNRNHNAGRFLASGPKQPRTGGVILATADSRDQLKAELCHDPFQRHGVARYQVAEFDPVMIAGCLESAAASDI